MMGQDESFVRLVRVAQEDPEIRRRLIAILSMPAKQRNPMLQSYISEMQIKQLPKDFIAAVSCLLADDVARAVFDTLCEQDEVGLPVTRSVWYGGLSAVFALAGGLISGFSVTMCLMYLDRYFGLMIKFRAWFALLLLVLMTVSTFCGGLITLFLFEKSVKRLYRKK